MRRRFTTAARQVWQTLIRWVEDVSLKLWAAAAAGLLTVAVAVFIVTLPRLGPVVAMPDIPPPPPPVDRPAVAPPTVDPSGDGFSRQFPGLTGGASQIVVGVVTRVGDDTFTVQVDAAQDGSDDGSAQVELPLTAQVRDQAAAAVGVRVAVQVVSGDPTELLQVR